MSSIYAHPMAQAYIKLMKNKYNKSRPGLPITLERLESVTQQIQNLGINLDNYLDIACRLAEPWMLAKGLVYPPLYMLVSTNIFKRIEKLWKDTGLPLHDEQPKPKAESVKPPEKEQEYQWLRITMPTGKMSHPFRVKIDRSGPKLSEW